MIHETTIDITRKLASWKEYALPWGEYEPRMIDRSAPIMAEHADGSVAVKLGTAFDPLCPNDEIGKLLRLARGRWSLS